MIIYESKLEGTQNQYEKLNAAIRTGRFVRNSIIRAWQDNQIKSRNEAYAYCKVLSDNPEFPWAKQLNSQAETCLMLKEPLRQLSVFLIIVNRKN
jgi:putative transposase